jgi:hypothetical protein
MAALTNLGRARRQAFALSNAKSALFISVSASVPSPG